MKVSAGLVSCETFVFSLQMVTASLCPYVVVPWSLCCFLISFCYNDTCHMKLEPPGTSCYLNYLFVGLSSNTVTFWMYWGLWILVRPNSAHNTPDDLYSIVTFGWCLPEKNFKQHFVTREKKKKIWWAESLCLAQKIIWSLFTLYNYL